MFVASDCSRVVDINHQDVVGSPEQVLRIEWQRSLPPEADAVDDTPDGASGSGMPGSTAPSSSNLAAADEALAPVHQNVMSFRKLQLTVGELDLQTDEQFLEAIIAFAMSLPLADMAQDEVWEERQQRLLGANVGPHELQALALNLAPVSRRAMPPLHWVHARELHELQVLKDQSNLSNWYFIEEASVSDININCTITLTSKVLAGGRQEVGGEEDDDDAERAGIFNKLMGAQWFF